MLKTVLNTNIIPHIWKLANIVPIPNPNKDIGKGTSYRPISLLSVIAKTLEKSLLPYITGHIPNTPTRVQNTTLYSDSITLSKQHRSKGVQPNGSPCANNHCSTRLSKAFDTINIHTLIRKLLQNNIPGTIIKFITNYIKGRKAYTTYISQFKTGIPLGGIISSTLFNIYTADIRPPRAPVQIMAYADDITITSTSAAKKYIQPYLHEFLPGQDKTISHEIQTKQLALCSLQTLQNIREIWT